METKRKAEESALMVASKKTKNDLAIINNRSKQLQSANSVPRTSNLFAPIMLLEGHEGDIFTVDYHPEGQYLASSGFDRKIFLWSIYGECENVSVMTGHSGAVMQVQFSADGAHLYSASTDSSLGLWDIARGERVKRFRGHAGFVNSVCATRKGPQMIVSASDDCSVRVWDARRKGSVATLQHKYQVVAVALGDSSTSSGTDAIYTAGIDNDVSIWDGRQRALVSRLKGHTDTITGLTLSPDGSYLLSNAMDNTVRVWDVRPFAPAERCVKVFTGHLHNFERNLLRCAWSPDGSRITAGSADRFVYVWDTTSRRILYKLPGHNGSVNDVRFHPEEPIIASGSSDKHIYLGEIAATGNLIDM